MKQYLKRSTAWMLCLALLLGLFAGIPGAVITKASAAETEPSEEVQNLLADYNASFEDHEIAGWTIDKGVNQSRQQATDGNAWSLINSSPSPDFISASHLSLCSFSRYCKLECIILDSSNTTTVSWLK